MKPVGAVGAWLKRVVDGYYRYHAVPGNLVVLGRFRTVFACCGGKALQRHAVSGGNRDGIVVCARFSNDGFLDLVLCIRIPTRASMPLIRR